MEYGDDFKDNEKGINIEISEASSPGDLNTQNNISSQETELGDDWPGGVNQKVKINLGDISDKDRLKFAKGILIVLCAVLLISIAVHVKCDNKAAQEVWEFSTEMIKTVTLLVIGYYFASKK